MADYDEIKLDNPTVKDLVDLLSRIKQDKKILIEDPDTGWDITVIYIYERENKIYMTGKYGEMTYE